MASISSKIIHIFLKTIQFNTRLANKISSPDFGKEKHQEVPKKWIQRYHIETLVLNNQKMYMWQGQKKKHQPIIFYIHGGAFVQRQNSLHFHLFKKLVSRVGCIVIAPDYPLVPHANVDEIYKHLTLCYEKAKDLYKNQPMIWMGDSAGGGLALGLAKLMHQEQGLINQKIILLSPWLDVSMNDPKIVEIQKQDAILNHDTLQKIGKLYAGSHALNDPVVNPLVGSFSGIKHIAVWSGTYDILYADALALKENVSKEDVILDMHIYENMLHTWIYFGILESKQAMNEIVQTILQMSEIKT